MLRGILGAIGGYVAMVVMVMVGIGLMWLVVGAEGAFDGEGPYPSTIWITGNLVFGFIAAVLGGRVAAKIGSALAVKILIGLIVVLGVIFALTADSSYGKREAVDKPVSDMSFLEGEQHARQPGWYNWVIPIIGVAGVALSGREKNQVR